MTDTKHSKLPRDEYPEDIWIYKRTEFKFEARTSDIIIGNIKYVRADNYERVKAELAVEEDEHQKTLLALIRCDAERDEARRLAEEWRTSDLHGDTEPDDQYFFPWEKPE